MIVNRAFRVRRAWILCAGAVAFVVDASLVGRAIGVAPATDYDTGDPWITAETRRTGALCVVINANALCSISANHRLRASRYATMIDARVGPTAVAVRSATH